MSVPAVLINKTTKLIMTHSVYPREDMQPITAADLDPNYEWLVCYTPFAEPSYDSRIFIMEEITPKDDALLQTAEHPNYPGIKCYPLTYNPIKRPNAEIIVSIENAEKEANNLVFSESIHKDALVFMVGSLDKKVDGQALTTDEQSEIDKLALIKVQFAKNRDCALNKIAQVEAEQTPNISEGWQNTL